MSQPVTPVGRPFRSSWFWVSALGALILAIGGFLIALLVSWWTAVEQATTKTPTPPTSVKAELLGFAGVSVSPGTAILMLVVFAAAVGSFVHVATSFSTYVGNRQFKATWVWWYLLRVFIGTSLALLFYFAFRGGFFANSATSDVNPYGIAAISGLAGLFSKQATDKLQEVFNTLFQTAPGQGDDTRKNGLADTTPRIADVAPKAFTAGDPATKVKVTGSGFTKGSTGRIKRNGSSSKLKTEFASATEISVELEKADLAKPGTIRLTVVNPDPGGGTSNSVDLTVG